jgi:LysM repeat protein
MALDFDLDGSFNDDEDFESAPDFDEDFDSDDENEGEGEDEPRRRSPLRLILLVLLILVLLCVVCWVGSSRLPQSITDRIPGLGGSQPAPVAQTSEPAPPATDEAPPAATEETQPPEATDEAQPPEQPTEESPVVIEPTDEPTTEATGEPGVEPTEEPSQPTATTVVVPGPTATLIPTDEAMPTTEPTTEPGPTVIITPESCDNNIPPVADAGGPYDAMRGKGQAVVTFDGSGSSDSDGMIISYEWDFGDNSAVESGETVTHGYTSVGSYVATLTVTDDCGAIGQDTADVTIVGPTPPAGTGTPTTETPTPTPTPYASTQGTLGFCYRVKYGDTLSGLAWRFGVPWPDLAYVNNIPMNYYVIAGQGLFIPTGQIIDGPNLYQVENGDTLNSVAFQCGLLTTDLAQANGLNIDASLSPGQLLMIPPWNYIKYY